MSEPSSVASWLGEKSGMRDSEWTRERDDARKKSTDKEKKSSKKDDKFIREMNKRLKAIYEDSGLEFGDDAEDERTVIDRFTVATKLRKKQVAEVFRQIRRSRNVELCFLVDATGSMQPHIDGVRDSILKIVEKLTDTGPHISFALRNGGPEVQQLRLAFVAYRDHCDSTQFEVLSFTRSAADFKRFCSNIRADGGGDTCEDVFGGLEKVLELDWSDNAGTKVLFHICDAPGHGRQYHNGLSDSYSSGDPKGRTHEGLMSKLRTKNIQYHFGKINSHTDLMLQKFSQAYGEQIVEFDVKRVDDIRESVITAVSISVSTSISASKAASTGTSRVERTYTFDKEEPDWWRCPTMTGKLLSYDFPDSIKDIVDDVPLGRRPPKTAEVKIGPNPFSKGAERVAFYGKDVSPYVDEKAKGSKGSKSSIEIKNKDEDIVLKEYLHRGKGMNSAKRYELSNQMQTIASFLAKEFSTELKKHFPAATTLKFLKIRTLFVGSTSGDRFMSCERRFSATDKFVRFSNNAFYELTEKKAVEMGVPIELLRQVMAFSHWTYKASNRFLMVVDLEGIVSKELSSGETIVLMTDPAIHCQDLTRYGKMNHGTDGMNGFFSKHECNHYCHALGLGAYLPLDEDSD